MPKVKLTHLAIEKAEPPETGRIELWDTQTAGLCLRVMPRKPAKADGSPGDVPRSWSIRYRLSGAQRRFKLGDFPQMTLKAARAEAGDAFALVRKGIDPQTAREAAREAEKPLTFSEAFESYIERYQKRKNRSWRQVEDMIRLHVQKRFGRKPLADISKKSIGDHLDKIAATRPHSANKVYRFMRKFFGWAQGQGLLAIHPMEGLTQPAPEDPRDRVLSDDEIKSLWPIWEGMGYPFGTLYKVLLLTAARRNEVARMLWDDIDLDGALWSLSSTQTKNKRNHEIPLSPQVLAILREIPKQGQHVFSTRRDRPISGFSAAKRDCDTRAAEAARAANAEDIPAWRLHDLRRSAASGMADLGILPHIIEKILNHKTGEISGIAGTYNRAEYRPEKREALEAWGRHVERLVSDSPATDNVVALRKGT